jgi:hypothetical protein
LLPCNVLFAKPLIEKCDIFENSTCNNDIFNVTIVCLEKVYYLCGQSVCRCCSSHGCIVEPFRACASSIVPNASFSAFCEFGPRCYLANPC